MLMKIIRDFRGSPDGATVIDYVAGASVDMPDDLAEVARQEGWAVDEGDAPVDKGAPEKAARKK